MWYVSYTAAAAAAESDPATKAALMQHINTYMSRAEVGGVVVVVLGIVVVIVMEMVVMIVVGMVNGNGDRGDDADGNDDDGW